MAYETSYDSGLKPFNHDKDRGKWSSPKDFIFACMGHTFKVDAIFVMPTIMLRELGIYALIPHLLGLGLCIAPIIFMQSFLGQFSSTGFISIFRIAPLFKGIGYVSLFLNFLILTYHGVLGAIPLLYLFYSARPTIPWSCEASLTWMKLGENMTSICEKNYTIYAYDSVRIPSKEFFKLHISVFDFEDSWEQLETASFSWTLMICTIIVWGVVAALLIRPIEMIGKFLRFSCLAVIASIAVCFLRFIFLPGALMSLNEHAEKFKYVIYWPMMTAVTFSSLGPGWGSIITMASYNNFQTNIFRSTWILSLVQVCFMVGFSYTCIFVTDFMLRDDPTRYFYQHSHAQWLDILMIPTGLTFLEMPHLWTLLFLSILILGVLNLLVVQLSSVLTSLFDEHEILRSKKKEITLGTVGLLAVLSIFFCSNHGIAFFEAITVCSVMTQMALNFLLIIVVLWVYGRERFQRDLIFMTNRLYSTWMVNIVRYVAPFILFFGWTTGFAFYLIGPIARNNGWIMFYFAVFVMTLLPWCLVPGYCIFKLMQTTGMLGIRLRRGMRPTDWYPADPVDRQKYEQKMNNTEISHQLTVEPEEL